MVFVIFYDIRVRMSISHCHYCHYCHRCHSSGERNHQIKVKQLSLDEKHSFFQKIVVPLPTIRQFKQASSNEEIQHSQFLLLQDEDARLLPAVELSGRTLIEAIV